MFIHVVWLHAAFESKASVQMPSDHEISNSWVIISWEPLTSVVDRNGNPLGAVMGFYITYQVCICYIYACIVQKFDNFMNAIIYRF